MIADSAILDECCYTEYMTYYLREYMTRIRPPRPPPGLGRDLVFTTPEESDEFQRILWRKALARAIRAARREARDRNDPALKAKLRHLYKTLWGGRKAMADAPSEAADTQVANEQRRAHD